MENLSGEDASTWLRQGDFSVQSGVRAGGAFLDRRNRPTAIFASNDEMAAGVFAAAMMRGLILPRDLSICGFDDSSIAKLVWPTLTTIHQPLAHMARLATRQLLSPQSNGSGQD